MILTISYKNMFLTKKGSFNNEFAAKSLKEIQPIIREIIKNNDFKAEVLKEDGRVIPLTFSKFPLDLYLENGQKKIVRKIAKDFLIGNKLEKNVSESFIYSQLIDLLCTEDFYLNDNFNSSISGVFFNKLKSLVFEETSTTKVVFFSVIGASLNRGDVCTIGSVKFMNPEDFAESHKSDFDKIYEQSADLQVHIDNFLKCDAICQIKIKNRDTITAKTIANEIIKRVYTLVIMSIPKLMNKSNFLGTKGEKYLESKSCFLFKKDSNSIKNIEIESSVNHFYKNNINLLEDIRPCQEKDSSFKKIESIIANFIADDKLNPFEQRIWTALYWYREAIYEKELNPSIIKYATCLESLFNSREGGISEQISEFTAYIVASDQTKEERMRIYSHTKTLYGLRSNAVHGSSSINKLDNVFLEETQTICLIALIKMAYYCGVDYYQGKNGYDNFVQYILKEHRFL